MYHTYSSLSKRSIISIALALVALFAAAFFSPSYAAAEEVEVAYVSDSVTVEGSPTSNGTQGVFEIVVDVTAGSETIYVDPSARRGSTMTTKGLNYRIEDVEQGGALTQDGNTSQTVTVAAAPGSSTTPSVVDGFYEIATGTTARVTLTVDYDPTASSTYRLQLLSVNYNNIPDDPDTQVDTKPRADFETGNYTSNLVVVVDVLSATAEVLAPGSTSTPGTGRFEIEFNVKVQNGGNVFISTTTKRGNNVTSNGINYRIEKGDGTNTNDGSTSASFTGGATTDGYFQVPGGKNNPGKDLTLTVDYDAASNDTYNLQLVTLNYALTAVNPDLEFRFVPRDDYESPAIAL